jgi:hypothetical protein
VAADARIKDFQESRDTPTRGFREFRQKYGLAKKGQATRLFCLHFRGFGRLRESLHFQS